MERPHKSDSSGKIAEALAKAQGTMEAAKKTSENPHFRSSYADLAACIEAAQPYLSDNGLAVVQATAVDASGHVELITELIHVSGEWYRSYWPIRPVKPDPQGYGSATTYARRYCFQAIIGQPSKDDDANAASGRDVQAKAPNPSKANGNVQQPVRTAPVPPSRPDLAGVVFQHPDPKAQRLCDRTLGDIYAEDRMTLHNIMKSPKKRAGLSSALRQDIGNFLIDRELERKRETETDDGPESDMVFELENA